MSRATSAATSLMRSRNSAFSTRSAAHVDSVSRRIDAISPCSLARSSIAAANCASSWTISARSLLTAPLLRTPAWLKLFAKIVLDFFRGFKIRRAAAGLRTDVRSTDGLDRQVALPVLVRGGSRLPLRSSAPSADAQARQCAWRVRRACRALRSTRLAAASASAAFAPKALFRAAHRALIVRDADLHRFDLRALRRKFDALAVGHD